MKTLILVAILSVMVGVIARQEIEIKELRDQVAELSNRADTLQRGTVSVSRAVYRVKQGPVTVAQGGGSR